MRLGDAQRRAEFARREPLPRPERPAELPEGAGDVRRRQRLEAGEGVAVFQELGIVECPLQSRAQTRDDCPGRRQVARAGPRAPPQLVEPVAKGPGAVGSQPPDHAPALLTDDVDDDVARLVEQPQVADHGGLARGRSQPRVDPHRPSGPAMDAQTPDGGLEVEILGLGHAGQGLGARIEQHGMQPIARVAVGLLGQADPGQGFPVAAPQRLHREEGGPERDTMTPVRLVQHRDGERLGDPRAGRPGPRGASARRPRRGAPFPRHATSSRVPRRPASRPRG